MRRLCVGVRFTNSVWSSHNNEYFSIWLFNLYFAFFKNVQSNPCLQRACSNKSLQIKALWKNNCSDLFRQCWSKWRRRKKGIEHTWGTANDMRLMSLQSQGSNRTKWTNNHRMRGSLQRKSNWNYCRGKRDDMMDWKALLFFWHDKSQVIHIPYQE